MNEYTVGLLDTFGQERAGASFPAKDDAAAEDEARALALEHEWAHSARIFCKATNGRWFITLESFTP